MAIWIDDECLGDVNKADAIRWIEYQYEISLASMNRFLWDYLDLKISQSTSNKLIEEEYIKFRSFILYPYMTDQISKETWERYCDKMYNEMQKLLR